MESKTLFMDGRMLRGFRRNVYTAIYAARRRNAAHPVWTNLRAVANSGRP